MGQKSNSSTRWSIFLRSFTNFLEKKSDSTKQLLKGNYFEINSNNFKSVSLTYNISVRIFYRNSTCSLISVKRAQVFMSL